MTIVDIIYSVFLPTQPLGSRPKFNQIHAIKFKVTVNTSKNLINLQAAIDVALLMPINGLKIL